MLWMLYLCLIFHWSQAKSIDDGYKHDTIPDNNHQQVIEEKEMWLDDFTNDKVTKQLNIYIPQEW